MDRNLRIYVATQSGCKPCEITIKTLGSEIAGVPVYIVDLSLNPDRKDKMGVSKSPTIFIVDVKDLNNDGIKAEDEEYHLWHQAGMISDTANLEANLEILKHGGKLTSSF